MTTTADKIKVMQAFEEGKYIQEQPFKQGPWEDRKTVPPWNWGQDNYRIKPADPEPLEFYVNYYGDELQACVYTSLESAIRARSPGGRTVNTRQVTPQDELDRKDARRYRKYKEIFTKDDRFWTYIHPRQWDEMLDKAMEGG